MKRFFLPFFCFLNFSVSAQSFSSADIYLGLRKLNVLGSVLYVAAHPDDENTRLITYFSKDRLYRTGYLSMTRGDGGQNLIGDEQGITLGLIRTQELLTARKIDGGEQFFTRAYDFGFSKNPEETFTKWDKEKILSDAVWVIRKFQPDVIITRFPTTGEGGHGHHTASAIIANEAFTAAADPKRFPEQLKYVGTWQAKRILWNSFNFGGVNLQRPDQFSFDVGGFNAILGKSYGEIAATSRSQHKSQGFGASASRGEAMEFFATTGGKPPVTDLFNEVETSWSKVKGGEAIKLMIDKMIASFDFLHPELTVKSLVQLNKAISALPAGSWKEQKLKEVHTLIEQCSGLWFDVFTNEPYAVQADSTRFNFSINNRIGSNTILKSISVDGFDTSLQQSLAKNKNLNFSKTIFVPAEKSVTQPYWLQQKMDEGYFNVSDQRMIGEPNVQPAFVVKMKMEIEGQELLIERPVQYRHTDPVKGEMYQPFVVLPPATFTELPPFYLKNEKDNYIDINLKANKNLVVPQPATISKVSANDHSVPLLLGPFSLAKDQVINIPYPIKSLSEKTYKINIAPNDERGGYMLTTISYDHIPTINYFKEAVTTIKTLDLKIVGKKIGYIVGAGDKVPEALEQMGYEVTLLGDKELSRNNLSQFNTIITGIRAYNTNEWMNRHYERLMKYVEGGGNLIVQYNTSSNLGPVRAKMGPYNFNIGRSRVTDENAPVKFLKPEHAVLNFPNKITQDDFKGWVQERSLYHATGADAKFESIFGINDPGEQQDNGSLIIAKYGKGYFTYTGLVFFRELPAGVPGAYRLLANIIALNYKKTF